jgi:hypothetical protein
MPLVIPDIIIQDTLEAILASIKSNWTSNADKTKTILYRMLNGLEHGNYNYYEQAQEIFLRTKANQREIKVKSSFPKDKSEFPCIIVNNPNRGTGQLNSLGFDQNSIDPIYNTGDFTFESNTARSFESTHSIMIFSDNKNEVQLIYYVLEAFFIIEQLKDHLHCSGLENIKISGREVQKMEDIPSGVYIRALQLSYFTQQVVDGITASAMIQSISFNGLANDKLSLDASGITAIQGLTYVGGQGSSTLRLTWTDNSDSTGNANANDTLFVTLFNSDKGYHIYSEDEAIRSDGMVDIDTLASWDDVDNIKVIAKFLRGDSTESQQTEINIEFEI